MRNVNDALLETAVATNPGIKNSCGKLLACPWGREPDADVSHVPVEGLKLKCLPTYRIHDWPGGFGESRSSKGGTV